MELFLWTLLALYVMAALGKIIWLVKGEAPPRTLKEVGVDLAIGITIIVWVVALLVRGA